MTTEIVWSRTRPIRKPKSGQVTRRTQSFESEGGRTKPNERDTGRTFEKDWTRCEEDWG